MLCILLLKQMFDFWVGRYKAQRAEILMYSASAKGCNKPGCRVQTIVNSCYQDFPPIPRGRHNFPPCPECVPVDFPPSRSGNKPRPQGQQEGTRWLPTLSSSPSLPHPHLQLPFNPPPPPLTYQGPVEQPAS